MPPGQGPGGRRWRGRRDDDRIPAALRRRSRRRSARAWSRGRCTPPVGRLWRLSRTSGQAVLARVAGGLRPVAEAAAERGVKLAIEPLNRYETSLINTVDAGPRTAGCRRSPRLRPAARHLPHEHRGEGPGSGGPGGRPVGSPTCMPAGPTAAPRARTRSTGRRSSPPSARRATTARCASSRSPRRTR